MLKVIVTIYAGVRLGSTFTLTAKAFSRFHTNIKHLIMQSKANLKLGKLFTADKNH